MESLTYVADHAAESNTFLQDDKSEEKESNNRSAKGSISLLKHIIDCRKFQFLTSVINKDDQTYRIHLFDYETLFSHIT